MLKAALLPKLSFLPDAPSVARPVRRKNAAPAAVPSVGAAPVALPVAMTVTDLTPAGAGPTAVAASQDVQPLPAGLTRLPDAADFAEHRAAMLRFARRKIRDAELAEDTVQDALVAALASRTSFQGQSALRTWLIGILNHKIQDAFRRESRYVRPDFGDSDGGDAGGDDLERLSRADVLADIEDNDPVVEVARRRMRERLVAEIEALPPTLKEVFTLQALEGVDTEEVCRRLSITEANCWVRLHRARKRLAQRMHEHLE